MSSKSQGQRRAAKSKKRGPRGKKPASVKKRILLDKELEDAWLEANAEMVAAEKVWIAHQTTASRGGFEVDLAVKKLFDEAKAKAADAKGALDEDGYWEFRIVAIQPNRWFKLKADHPPTDEQQNEFAENVDEMIDLAGMTDSDSEAVRRLQRTLAYNPDTFPREAFALCIKPKLDDEELDILCDEDGPFTAAERQDLLKTCVDVNEAPMSLR